MANIYTNMVPVRDVQTELDAYLAYTASDVVVWHDPAGAYAGQLPDLIMPPDAELVVEDEHTPFALKVRLSGIGPDERLVLYRRRQQGVVEDDWIADIEARAESLRFDVLVLDEVLGFTGAPAALSVPEILAGEADLGSAVGEAAPGPAVGEVMLGGDPLPAPTPAPGSFGMIEDDGIGKLADALGQDWYTLDDFRAVVREVLGGREDLPDDVAARMCDFTLYKDCALRSSWPMLSSYYESFFRGLVVAHTSIPETMRRSGTFRTFLYQAETAGRILDYDEESWITADGLAELEVTPSMIEQFAHSALRAAQDTGHDVFTVPLLMRDCPGLELFEFECSPAFYESALCSQRDILASILLSRRRIFMAAGARYKGRDLLVQIVKDEGSLYVDELLDLLSERYGITQTRSQVIALVKQTDMHFERSIDRIYIDRNRFIEEVE